MKRLTLEEFITKARLVHGDKYNYSLVHYINYNIPIIIICPIHDQFEQLPSNHLSGKGCKDCGVTNSKLNKVLTQEKFEKRAKLKHGENEYDYSKSKYVNYISYVWLKHNICGYEFKEKPYKHLNGKCCPKCSEVNRNKKRTKWTKEECIKQAKKYNIRSKWKNCKNSSYNKSRINGWLEECCEHMERVGNNQYRCIYSYKFENINDLKYVYIGLTYNLKERDKQHKINGSLYKFCQNHKVDLPLQTQLSDYINKNEASKLEGIYLKKYRNDGWIIINKVKTGNLGGGLNLKERSENFFKKAYKVHKDKYDYSQVKYINSKLNVLIIHKECGREFPQTPSNHLRGHGCPKCSKLKNKCQRN